MYRRNRALAAVIIAVQLSLCFIILLPHSIFALGNYPAVTTQAASDITYNQAKLNGTVTDLGASNVDYVGAGRGTVSVPDNPGDVDPLSSNYELGGYYSNNISSAPTAFSMTIQTDLSPGTLYYFRMAAHNDAGWAWGDEESFLTRPQAPTNVVRTVTGGGTGVDLSWTKGSGAQETKVLRKAGDWPASHDDGTATEVYYDNGTSCSDAGLAPGTIYYYRLWSYATEGGHEQWSSGYAQVASIDPPAVTTHDATNITETGCRLHGEITDNNGANVSAIRYTITSVFTATYSLGPYAVGDHYRDFISLLSPGTKYTWKFEARNTAGWDDGGQVDFLTLPRKPKNLAVTSMSSSQIDLTWTKGNGAGRTLIVRKAGSTPADRNDGAQVYYSDGTSFSDTSLVGNVHYYYRLWSEKSVDSLQQYSSDNADGDATTSAQAPQEINTATGTGQASFAADSGTITGLTATDVSATPCGTAPSGYTFPHGLFSYNVTVANAGDAVTLTITLPQAVASGTQYWKCQDGSWVNVTSLIGSNDGDNVLTLTITDGGLGDADGTANGVIVDPGGPTIAVAPAAASTTATATPAFSPAPSVAPSLYTPTPSRILVPMVTVTPRKAAANQPVTIYTNIANRGETAGSYTAELKINGQVEQTKSGEIGANMAIPLEFTVNKDWPGTYQVDINGQKSCFTVVDSGNSKGRFPVDRSTTVYISVVLLLCATAMLAMLVVRRLRQSH